MYSILNEIIRIYLKLRYRRIEAFYSRPHTTQKKTKRRLWQVLKKTKYCRENGYENLSDCALTAYDDVKPFIERMMNGEPDVLWPGKTRWFSKSSGTTNDRSKYLPITDAVFRKNILRSSWDTMALVYRMWPDANIFAAKNLIMGGSLQAVGPGKDVFTGDVSAIMISRMPSIGRPFYVPDFDTALMGDWEEKINRVMETTLAEDVVMFGGVPTWNIVLFDKILQATGKQNILEVWPNLKVYLHGGVSFAPYREKFRRYLPIEDFHYVEVYNASEGYFAVSDGHEGMLLLLDNDIYYEFLPFDLPNAEAKDLLSLDQVEEGRIYSIVITTSAGLVRYMPGDTIEFVSTHPYRIKVVGRTAQYINTFGEEVMVGNTDKALYETCKAMNVEVLDYTAGPRYYSDDQPAGHEWLVEFVRQPTPLDEFEALLDKNLRQVNSDYDAKRFKDMALKKLNVVPVEKGTFHRWLESKGKMGGQNKVPRLCNDRRYLDEILRFSNGKKSAADG